ncbi:hypothetical protein SAMN05216559_1184 [Halomicrobium zhouii]|uniref:Yip1 domain-containing protein n=1 Tax=Halomicrobium zhouii TaxID=767519 RepID=A0A1I6KNW6_9EURY|nr:Yip1 family protein [Halomicrobium zhouii]SFR92933.1 hypothetical protein SAMN05216559_1184 [Halomicrobium zhouii]
MFENVGTLLTNPGRFFDGRADDPSLKEPTLVVLSIVVISAISGAVTIYQFMQMVPENVQLFLLIGGIVGIVIGSVGPFITWLLYAVAFQIISYFFGGEGEFRDTFALTGWGFVPRIFGAILSLVATVYVIQTLQVSGDPAAFQTFNSRLTQQTFYQLATGVGILFSLWSAYIWIPAVQRARNVTRNQAIVTVAIPVLFGILLTVGSLAITGGL